MSHRSTDFLFGKNAPNEDSVSIYRPPPGPFPHLEKDFPDLKMDTKETHLNKPPENIRLYLTLKKSLDSNIEYKKMILMTSCLMNFSDNF